MSKLDVIRARKDEEYSEKQSEEERKARFEHPSGMIELVDADLETVAGAISRRRRPRK